MIALEKYLKMFIFCLTLIQRTFLKEISFFSHFFIFLKYLHLEILNHMLVCWSSSGNQHNGIYVVCVAGLALKLRSKDCSMNLATLPLTRWKFDRHIYPLTAIMVSSLVWFRNSITRIGSKTLNALRFHCLTRSKSYHRQSFLLPSAYSVN